MKINHHSPRDSCTIFLDFRSHMIDLHEEQTQIEVVLRLLSSAGSGPPQFYIGLGPRIHGPVHSVTRFVQYILANLTGTVTNLTESQCQNPSELSTENKDVSKPSSH